MDRQAMPDAGLPLELCASESIWNYAEPFVISRGVIRSCEVLEIELIDGRGRRGRSETCGITYAGETPATMLRQIRAVEDAIRGGIDRMALLDRLPAGGARCAIDTALWDLETKQGHGDPFSRCGVRAEPVVTGYTIGMRSVEACEKAAADIAGCAWIKVKVGAEGVLEAVKAVRRGAPTAALIVDPNQAWSVAQLRELAPALHGLGVALLEQPVPAGQEAALDGYVCPVPLCADESLDDIDDLPRIQGRFQAVNIKLDKVGGLTAAWRLADAAAGVGLDLMVGCMGGTSLAMAPAMVLAQRCRYVDLDGPRLLATDRVPGFEFRAGVVPVSRIGASWG